MAGGQGFSRALIYAIDKEEYRFSPSVNDQCLNIGRKGDSHPRNVAALRRAGTSVHFHREI